MKLSPRARNITGRRFGRLEVLEAVRVNQWQKVEWACRCDCGLRIIVRSDNLTQGASRSCGCLKKRKR